jgi:hypothetical protein
MCYVYAILIGSKSTEKVRGRALKIVKRLASPQPSPKGKGARNEI